MLTGINSDTLRPLSWAMVFTMQISVLPSRKTGCVWKKHSLRERSYIHSLEVSHIYPCCIKLASARKSISWLCGFWVSKFTVNVVRLLWIVFQTLEFHEKLFLNLQRWKPYAAPISDPQRQQPALNYAHSSTWLEICVCVMYVSVNTCTCACKSRMSTLGVFLQHFQFMFSDKTFH